MAEPNTSEILRQQAYQLRDELVESLQNDLSPKTITSAKKILRVVAGLLHNADQLDHRALFHEDPYMGVLESIRSDYAHTGVRRVWGDGVAKILQDAGVQIDAAALEDRLMREGVLRRRTDLICKGCEKRKGTWTDEGLQRLRDEEEGGMYCEGCEKEGEEPWRLIDEESHFFRKCWYSYDPEEQDPMKLYLAIVTQPDGRPQFLDIFAHSPEEAKAEHDKSLFGSHICKGWDLVVIYEVRDCDDWLRLCSTHKPHGYRLDPKAYDALENETPGVNNLYFWSARLYEYKTVRRTGEVR